jgi:2-succinyl-6-hydroxy-2,4-cyclohexadiene-1-carboxylate synthase
MSRVNLVFLHGFLGCKEDWTPMCTGLSSFASCYAFDLPGHGTAGPITPHYLETVHAQIQLFHATPILVGYSMGGRLALQLAERYTYPHVIALSAYISIVDAAEREARLERDLEWVRKLRTMDMRAFLHEWYDQPLFASLKARPDLLEGIVQRRSVQNPERMAEVLNTLSVARHSPIRTFPKRLLFLYGERDEKYKALYATLPNARGIPDTGHVLHLENPEQCIQHILQEVSA